MGVIVWKRRQQPVLQIRHGRDRTPVVRMVTLTRGGSWEEQSQGPVTDWTWGRKEERLLAQELDGQRYPSEAWTEDHSGGGRVTCDPLNSSLQLLKLLPGSIPYLSKSPVWGTALCCFDTLACQL